MNNWGTAIYSRNFQLASTSVFNNYGTINVTHTDNSIWTQKYSGFAVYATLNNYGTININMPTTK